MFGLMGEIYNRGFEFITFLSLNPDIQRHIHIAPKPPKDPLSVNWDFPYIEFWVRDGVAIRMEDLKKIEPMKESMTFLEYTEYIRKKKKPKYKLTGKQEEVVLGSRDRSVYRLSLKLPDEIPGVVSLFLEAREGDSRSVVIQQLILDYRSITGNVIGVNKAIAPSYFVVFLVCLVILFYVVKFVMNRREHAKLGKGVHFGNRISVS